MSQVSEMVAVAHSAGLRTEPDPDNPGVVRIRNRQGTLLGMLAANPAGEITYGEMKAPGHRRVIGHFSPHFPETHSAERARIRRAIEQARS